MEKTKLKKVYKTGLIHARVDESGMELCAFLCDEQNCTMSWLLRTAMIDYYLKNHDETEDFEKYLKEAFPDGETTRAIATRRKFLARKLDN